MFDFSGQVAVVTGGASGLGKCIVENFARSGAKVIVLDVCKVLPQKFNGLDITLITLDVTNEFAVSDAANQILEQFGKVDCLVNCAGITRRMPAEEFNTSDFELVVKVNLEGTFLCCREFGKRMLEAGHGAIVNIASLGAHVAITNSAAYCASKGGVAQLTKTLGVEWAARGVRVNALTPGVFETPLLRQCIEQNASYGDNMLAKIPMGRFGKPQDLAGPALFLCSDMASYITGHILAVDAGYLAQ